MTEWLVGLISATGVSAWWMGFFNALLPAPERVRLALKNVRRGEAKPLEDRFRVVLCWLENDPKGKSTRHVEQAFNEVTGVALVRSARIVADGGAADEWREAMQKKARLVLDDWAADLAVIGLVKQPEALSLWFVPRSGQGTLGRGNKPYILGNATLGQDFHDDFLAALTAVALVAIAPLAETEKRGQVLEEGLRNATEKLATLLDTAAIAPGERCARMLSLADAHLTLGERERDSDRLERAVAAYRAALEERKREDVPLDWAATQNSLGNALQILGARESGTDRLEQAVAACRVALEERKREHVPLDWAATQNNLGNALRILGARGNSTDRLKEAVAAYRAALEERKRERVPLDWAATQNNLGNALQVLGERESGTDRLKEAVAAYRAALEERKRERVPLDWAATQNNLGNALQVLGGRESGTDRLKEAVAAYRAALEERRRDRVPLDWAMTQNNLGP